MVARQGVLLRTLRWQFILHVGSMDLVDLGVGPGCVVVAWAVAASCFCRFALGMAFSQSPNVPCVCCGVPWCAWYTCAEADARWVWTDSQPF